ncbi:hypothetical protein P148_SR1C00001G0149 [candidate division SR1 bacterium RAAC1_SR1_1]|nr:hypothetical protein P148_SR1C00001G0149 [candidate division SR1 bacterium RAAC1_SR1_1]
MKHMVLTINNYSDAIPLFGDFAVAGFVYINPSQ